MNLNSTDNHAGRKRFLANLTASEFFQSFQRAFHTLTQLPLKLRLPEAADRSVIRIVTTTNDAGVVTTRVPVRNGNTLIAIVETGGVRLQSGDGFDSFARALLENGSDAAEIRAVKQQFEQVTEMPPERYEAAVELVAAFAWQLGESAHRIVFAHGANEPPAVRHAKEFIFANLGEPMRLETVARAVNVTPFHFCKLFKRSCGLTFTDFVTRARVERAKWLLMKPAARITEVAFDVGFQSLCQFNRSFRRIASESPTEFRSRMKLSGGIDVFSGPSHLFPSAVEE